MKQIYFSLFLLTSVVGFSQTTAIPDANFEQALIDQEIDSDATINGEVLTADIAEITTVNVLNLAISDLTGIEDFTALTNLNVSGNLLTSLDLSQNTALRTINASNNQLTSLNIQNGNNGDLEAFVALGNPDLTCLQLDNPEFGEQNLTPFVDEGVSFSTDCSNAIEFPQTAIPDPIFEQALIDQGIDSDGIINSQVLTADIAGITSLDLFTLGISDLTGIEDFTSLVELFIEVNQLTTLDVTQNTALIALHASNNQLTSLDLTQNTALIELFLDGNRLTSLDLTQNTVLFDLDVSSNLLTSLNIQNGNNENLAIASAINNPNLACIQVDDIAFAEANFTDVDEGVSFSTDCPDPIIELPQTIILDPNFEQALIDLGIDSDGIINGQVPTADVAGVESLDLDELGISDLTGIEDFTSLIELMIVDDQLTNLDVTQNTALEILEVRSNQLTNLDVSANTELATLIIENSQITSLDLTQNTGLTGLNLTNNQLTSLDVTQNRALGVLRVGGNQLTSFDVSANTSLGFLDVSENQLTSLNIENGNNSGIAVFFANNNPNLSCIQVDDIAFAEANFTNIDSGVSFSTDCSEELSTDDFVLRDVTLFPNPTSNVLNITIPSSVVLERINIYNSVGQSVGSTQQTAISVSNLSDGIYFLEVITDKGLTTSRFIKN